MKVCVLTGQSERFEEVFGSEQNGLVIVSSMANLFLSVHSIDNQVMQVNKGQNIIMKTEALKRMRA